MRARRAGELQGWPEIAATIEANSDRGKKGNRLVPDRLIVHYLGNGVPRAMGEWLARVVLSEDQRTSPALTLEEQCLT